MHIYAHICAIQIAFSICDPGDLWPLIHLIRLMRKHDLANILTILKLLLFVISKQFQLMVKLVARTTAAKMCWGWWWCCCRKACSWWLPWGWRWLIINTAWLTMIFLKAFADDDVDDVDGDWIERIAEEGVRHWQAQGHYCSRTSSRIEHEWKYISS